MLSPTIRTKVWLELEGRFVIGEGGLDLLEAVERLRSLTGAAQAVGWSYRHAWGYLRNAERVLGAKLVVTLPGRGGARGTRLSPVGRLFLKQLQRARRGAHAAARQGWNSSRRQN